MDLTGLTEKILAKTIDHTLLKPEATVEQVQKLCGEAVDYGFASVCVNPGFVETAARELAGAGVRVCTVIGFPLGANTYKTKQFEAKEAVASGAEEVDMVVNIGALRAGDFPTVRQDISAVVAAARRENPWVLVKVILETCLLTNEQKRMACLLAREAEADFVKTSTGFSAAGATVEDVRLLKKLVGDVMQVKASGGIRDWETARQMLEAGADRLGASAGIEIIRGFLAGKN